MGNLAKRFSTTKRTGIERKITYKGEEITIYVRRLSAGQRAQLNKGMRVNPPEEAGGTPKNEAIDIGRFLERRMQQVLFTIVDSSGNAEFKSEADVRDLEADFLDLLFYESEEVNKPTAEDAEGKDLSGTSTND